MTNVIASIVESHKNKVWWRVDQLVSGFVLDDVLKEVYNSTFNRMRFVVNFREKLQTEIANG